MSITLLFSPPNSHTSAAQPWLFTVWGERGINGCNLSFIWPVNPEVTRVSVLMHRHVCITWCCKVTGVSVIYQRLRQEILLQWCCTSFKHFTVKALKCSRSSPSAHQALFVKWCLSKASQGQIWTTWEVMITFMKPKCFTSEDIFHCCCQCLECCQPGHLGLLNSVLPGIIKLDLN